MSNEKNKVIFFGTPDFAVPALHGLIKDKRFEIMAVITQPDKKVGRKQILTPPPVKVEAKKYGLTILQPGIITNYKLQITNFDLAVVVAYGQKIPAQMLKIPKYGFINLHGSLLPKYRGAACVQAAILNGDKITGITIMKIDKGLDTGPILKQAKIKISADETAQTLHDKLAELGTKILPEALLAYINGELKPLPQDNEKSSYVKQLKKEDGKIDWGKKAIEIERMVRALSPWPGAYAKIKNNLVLKILEVERKPLPVNNYQAGKIFLHNNKLAVQCGEGALAIENLQLEGKKAITAEEFLNGHKELIGSILI